MSRYDQNVENSEPRGDPLNAGMDFSAGRSTASPFLVQEIVDTIGGQGAADLLTIIDRVEEDLRHAESLAKGLYGIKWIFAAAATLDSQAARDFSRQLPGKLPIDVRGMLEHITDSLLRISDHGKRESGSLVTSVLVHSALPTDTSGHNKVFQVLQTLVRSQLAGEFRQYRSLFSPLEDISDAVLTVRTLPHYLNSLNELLIREIDLQEPLHGDFNFGAEKPGKLQESEKAYHDERLKYKGNIPLQSDEMSQIAVLAESLGWPLEAGFDFAVSLYRAGVVNTKRKWGVSIKGLNSMLVRLNQALDGVSLGSISGIELVPSGSRAKALIYDQQTGLLSLNLSCSPRLNQIEAEKALEDVIAELEDENPLQSKSLPSRQESLDADSQPGQQVEDIPLPEKRLADSEKPLTEPKRSQPDYSEHICRERYQTARLRRIQKGLMNPPTPKEEERDIEELAHNLSGDSLGKAYFIAAALYRSDGIQVDDRRKRGISIRSLNNILEQVNARLGEPVEMLALKAAGNMRVTVWFDEGDRILYLNPDCSPSPTARVLEDALPDLLKSIVLKPETGPPWDLVEPDPGAVQNYKSPANNGSIALRQNYRALIDEFNLCQITDSESDGADTDSGKEAAGFVTIAEIGFDALLQSVPGFREAVSAQTVRTLLASLNARMPENSPIELITNGFRENSAGASDTNEPAWVEFLEIDEGFAPRSLIFNESYGEGEQDKSLPPWSNELLLDWCRNYAVES
jgi:hypothetical protein